MKSNTLAQRRRDSSIFLLAMALIAVASKAADTNSYEARQNGDYGASSEGSPASQSMMMQEDEERDLVVGGKISRPEDFPYYVHFGKCGGSLIAPSVVLTAAHCGDLRWSTPVVGAYERGTISGNAVQRKVSKQVIYPGFTKSNWWHDLNLVLLNEPVILKEHTDIELELNYDDLIPADRQTVTVLGLGHLQYKGSAANKLRSVEVQKTADEHCKSAFHKMIAMEDSIQFCAGVQGGGKDACHGDSGGPLVTIDGRKHLQVGVVSFGTGCADARYPGTYARVSGDMKWIRSVVCDEWKQTDASFCSHFGTPQSKLTEWFRIESTGNFCLSLENGGEATDGEKLVMLPCDGTTQQQWIQFGNDFLIRSKMNPNMCIRVAPASDGSQMELYDCFDAKSSPFEGYSDDSIRLKDDASKCWSIVHVAGIKFPVPRLLDCSSEKDKSTQRWKISFRKDDYVITKTAVKDAFRESKHEDHAKSHAAKHRAKGSNGGL